MLSRGHISAAEGVWRPSRFPNKLLMSMMLMMMMVMSPCLTDSIEMACLLPADGFTIGRRTGMSIICSYNIKNLNSFRLLQNDASVVEMQYNVNHNQFITTRTQKGFNCTSLATGYFNCWKRDITCSDVASYICSTNAVDSSPKSFKVNSSIKNLTRVDVYPDKDGTPTFKCTANVAVPAATEVKFQWEIEFKPPLAPVHEEKLVLVPDSKTCYVEVASIYNHNDTFGSARSVSCTVFGQTMTETFYPPDKSNPTTAPTSAASDTLHMRRVLVNQLILLLLVVTVSSYKHLASHKDYNKVL